jgi:hypothetical protein
MTHHLSSDEASSSSGASSPLRIDGFGPPDVGNLTWNSIQDCCAEIYRMSQDAKSRPITHKELERASYLSIQMISTIKSVVEDSEMIKERTKPVPIPSPQLPQPSQQSLPAFSLTHQQTQFTYYNNNNPPPSTITCTSQNDPPHLPANSCNHTTVSVTTSNDKEPERNGSAFKWVLPPMNNFSNPAQNQPQNRPIQPATLPPLPITTKPVINATPRFIPSTNVTVQAQMQSFVPQQQQLFQQGEQPSFNMKISPLRDGMQDIPLDDQIPHKRKRGRKKTDKTHLICEKCKTTETPEWRRGPCGPATLCNACGIRFANKSKKEREARQKNSINRLINASNEEEASSGNQPILPPLPSSIPQ